MDQTDIGGPSYPAARTVAKRLEARIAAALDKIGDAPKPDARTIEEIITTAFWASLRREEGHAPRISIAFLPPEQSVRPIKFNPPVPADKRYKQGAATMAAMSHVA
jgi:hypothetical protein